MSTSLYVTSGDVYLDGGELGDRRLILTIRDPAGALVDLTGVDLTFLAKRRRTDLDADALITKQTPDDIELAASQTTTGKGLAYLGLEATDTATLDGKYPWELQAVDSVGAITLAHGTLYVTADLITTGA